ncbi:prepilin peptidase [Lusitaniella coriacea LEGE 07157]|uniref:Prepilin leader peptidase/N-methyltransferase n=1 Tax=Lusitaniella coriacea LEGE 07157 TaxID=945747 RepID=A0A8J7DZW4_9CYAN|nr:A24 family peptidase [Lusitaniella coriacea]MBE9118400.1 prepilin peptidase [Lusitaniella coriacea LEGE 07157]
MDALFRIVTTLLIFALGASIGSFLNVVVYRLPEGLSILFPPSRCPHCLHQLGKRENIPVFGWIGLKGRCLNCKAPISIRYPLVEAIAGFLFLAIFWRFGFNVETLGYWVCVSWLLALSLIDLDTMTLPNSLTKSGLVAGLVFMTLAGWQENGEVSGAIEGLMTGIVGAVLGLWLLNIISGAGAIALGKTAMGGGDAKLAALMGAWLGWKYLLVAGFLGCILGALISGGAIALRRLKRHQHFPFGPFLALGTLLTLFWGEFLLSTYLQLFFPL